MRIEIIECKTQANTAYGWNSCVVFTADKYVHNLIKNEKGIQGLVLIDDVAIKFDYSCLGNDGSISSKNDMHRRIVKSVVPIYAFNKFNDANAAYKIPQDKFL